MKATQLLDATGLSCPMPVVKTKQVMDTLSVGDILEVHTTESGSVSDLPAWAKSTGNEFLVHKEEDGVHKFWIKKR